MDEAVAEAREAFAALLVALEVEQLQSALAVREELAERRAAGGVDAAVRQVELLERRVGA